MRRLAFFLALLITAPAFADSVDSIDDQTVLKAFTEPAAIAGGPLWVTVLSNRTIEALWRDDPARTTLQIEAANAGSSFYVMGLATKTLNFKPEVKLIQNGQTLDGTVVNVAHLNGNAIPEGSVALGLLEFKEKVDLGSAFTLNLGGTQVNFAIDPRLAQRWGAITTPSGKGF
ncbi:hypothetical protein [Paraburkholderia fynbosensis]|uniref:Uncharacterized protein n=1 Tax=Paraburkholderia fynbosensis TaxID=1200993 RepID=A0A6J5H0S5_9BURK|nr:hypothetical protein [Paraburkholderia fynbosensis]CAB3806992.1 hypothetical protein LMG27177_06209 [Paraburkholderia fynbosensis]